MKIEKLTKDNIKEFIKDMALEDDTLGNDINKLEYYGVREDDTFLIGFISLPEDDQIAILFDNPKMNNEKFMECINFLKNNLVVRNHLITQVFSDKRIKALDELFKCREVYMNLKLKEDISSGTSREKYAEIDMKSIRYNFSKQEISCNLVRQNIQDEDMILKLHNYFMDLDCASISFVVSNDSMDYLKQLNYKCIWKSYVL